MSDFFLKIIIKFTKFFISLFIPVFYFPIELSYLLIDLSYLLIDLSYLLIDLSYLLIDSSYLLIDSSYFPIDFLNLIINLEIKFQQKRSSNDAAYGTTHKSTDYECRY